MRRNLLLFLFAAVCVTTRAHDPVEKKKKTRPTRALLVSDAPLVYPPLSLALLVGPETSLTATVRNVTDALDALGPEVVAVRPPFEEYSLVTHSLTEDTEITASFYASWVMEWSDNDDDGNSVRHGTPWLIFLAVCVPLALGGVIAHAYSKRRLVVPPPQGSVCQVQVQERRKKRQTDSGMCFDDGDAVLGLAYLGEGGAHVAGAALGEGLVHAGGAIGEGVIQGGAALSGALGEGLVHAGGAIGEGVVQGGGAVVGAAVDGGQLVGQVRPCESLCLLSLC